MTTTTTHQIIPNALNYIQSHPQELVGFSATLEHTLLTGAQNKGRRVADAHRQFKAMELDAEVLSVVSGEGVCPLSLLGCLWLAKGSCKTLNAIFAFRLFFLKVENPLWGSVG